MHFCSVKDEATKTNKTNLLIDALILSGEWHIDPLWGLQMLNRYLHQVELRNSGVPYSELGLSKMREQSKAKVLTPKGNLIDFPLDPFSEVKIPKGSIAKISLNGVMTTNDGLCHHGALTLAEQIRQADDNENLDGVYLEVFSGGGEGMAGQIINSAFQELKKPSVAHLHFSGSAAVLATLNVDERIGSSVATKVGSIGSYYSLDKRFLEFYKENVVDVYSKKSEDKNLPFREALEGNFELLEEMATRDDEMFMAQVRKALNLKGNTKQVKETLRGGMFPAKEAKQRGLIDSIGGTNYALSRLQSYIKFKKKKK